MAPKRVRWVPEEQYVYIPPPPTTPSPQYSPFSPQDSPFPVTPEQAQGASSAYRNVRDAVPRNVKTPSPIPAFTLGGGRSSSERSDSPSPFSAAGSSGLLPPINLDEKPTAPVMLHPLLALETHASGYYWNVAEDPTPATVFRLNGQPVTEQELNMPAVTPLVTHLDIQCLDVAIWKPLHLHLKMDSTGRWEVSYPMLTTKTSPHHSPSNSTEAALPGNRRSPPRMRNAADLPTTSASPTSANAAVPPPSQSVPIPRRMSSSQRGSFSSFSSVRPNMGVLPGGSPASMSSISASPHSSSSLTLPTRARSRSSSSPPVPAGLTVHEVLYGIYLYLQTPILEQEFKHLSLRMQNDVTRVFYRRCGHPPFSAEDMMRSEQYKYGLKRLDCLFGRNRFHCVVYSHSETGEDGETNVFKLNVIGDDGGPQRLRSSAFTR